MYWALVDDEDERSFKHNECVDVSSRSSGGSSCSCSGGGEPLVVTVAAIIELNYYHCLPTKLLSLFATITTTSTTTTTTTTTTIKQAMRDWNSFTYQTSQYFGVDLTCLSKQYEDEQRDYYLLSSTWAELRSEQVRLDR